MRDQPTRPGDSLIRVEEARDPASLDDVRSLLGAFALEFAPVVAEVFAVQGFAAELTGLPGRYAAPTGCLLVVRVGDRAAGCVALRDLGGGTCEMKRLYVAIPNRGQGLARTLVAAVIRRAESIGYRRMVLDTLVEMGAAIALYRTFGFREAAPYWNHPTASAVFMERSLVANSGRMTD